MAVSCIKHQRAWHISSSTLRNPQPSHVKCSQMEFRKRRCRGSQQLVALGFLFQAVTAAKLFNVTPQGVLSSYANEFQMWHLPAWGSDCDGWVTATGLADGLTLVTEDQPTLISALPSRHSDLLPVWKERKRKMDKQKMWSERKLKCLFSLCAPVLALSLCPFLP